MSEDAADELREYVNRVGARLGRSKKEVEPFFDILRDQWYDTVESISKLSEDEFQKFGIPYRFAKELAESPPSGKSSPSAPTVAPRFLKEDKEQHANTAKGKGRGNKSKEGDRGDSSKGYGSKGKEGKDGKDGKGKGKKGKARHGENNESEHHMIDLEEYNILPDSPFRELFLGFNSKNVKHIRELCSAQVWLYGQGSGYTVSDTGSESEEPLHVVVSAADEENLDKAVDMANDLIETVLEKYYVWLDTGCIGDNDGGADTGEASKDKGKGKGKSDRYDGKGYGKVKDKGKGKYDSKGKGKGKYDSKDKGKGKYDSWSNSYDKRWGGGYDDRPQKRWQPY